MRAVGRGSVRILLCVAVGVLMSELVAANVVLMADNVTVSFSDSKANFGPALKESGMRGLVYLSEPLNACKQLTNKAVQGPYSPFALIVRGGCTFDDKVRHAEDAGFKAGIVFDNVESDVLVSMAGSSSGIHIYSVFVSKASGEQLKRYAGRTDVELWLIPSVENSLWSILVISFISLLSMAAMLATCFFVRHHRVDRDQPGVGIREFHGMSSQLVRAMPSLVFSKVQDDFGTSSKCAICLESYAIGERLRMLPCRHQFHAACVDIWLITRRAFCPVCKLDVRAKASCPPATEITPLLPRSGSSTSMSSPARDIIRPQPLPPSLPRSISSTRSRSYRDFSSRPNIPTSKSSADLANAASSPLSRSVHLGSSYALPIVTPPYASQRYSLHIGSSSPLPIGSSPYMGQRYSSPHGSHNSYQTSSFRLDSASMRSALRRCGESGPSLSAMVSSYSPRTSQLQHGGESEANLTSAPSSQSYRQSYLLRCNESEMSLYLASAQSLPSC